MANIRSSIKRARSSERKRMRNKPIRTKARTMVGYVRRSLVAGDVDRAEQALVAAYSALDGAAQKGVIHRNNAARRKSRLAHAVKKAREQQAGTPS